MRPGQLERLAPLTGVLFVVLVVPSFFLGGEPPDSDDPPAEIVAFWTENDGELIAGAVMTGLGVLFLLWFAGSLRSALRVAEGGTGRLSAVAYSGAIVLAAGAAGSAGVQLAAADTAGDVPPEVTHTLSVLNSDAFIIFPVSIMTLVLASGLVIVRTGALPKWLGWVAIAVGVLQVTPVGFFLVFVFFAWVLVISMLLFMRGPVGGAPPPVAPVATGSPPAA